MFKQFINRYKELGWLDKTYKEKQNSFDIALVGKTLHHLRTGDCIARNCDPKHECAENEEGCIYGFEEDRIFTRLLELGKRVIIYEYFDPQEEDIDKAKGRGGYFTLNEWRRIFSYLLDNYEVEITHPMNCRLRKNELDKAIAKFKQVDCLCFYIEEKRQIQT